MNAKRFESTDTLKSGVTITIRAVRPDDRAAFAHAFAELDSQSVYTRFFQHKNALSEEELTAATKIDFENVVALVVTTQSANGEIIIGGARYVLLDPTSAEIAFLIEEDFHGQGIGGRLLDALIRIAREKGVTRFEAMVLAQNKAMLAVLARCGLPLEKRVVGNVVDVTMSLTGVVEHE